MSRSDYTWDVVEYQNERILQIIDQDRGRMSVTNNIENVVEEIKKELEQENKTLPELIIYRDSEGLWDGWDNKRESFILISRQSSLVAMEELIKRNEKKTDVDRS